jgi:hypothetical protein
MRRMLAGTSALPVPGGGAFALTLREHEINAIAMVILIIFIIYP